MVAVKYSIKDLEAKTELKCLEKRLTQPEKALKECGLVLLRSISKTFKAGGRPVRWHPSKRAMATGDKTLIKSGDLKNSITMRVGGNKLTVGTNKKYAAIHQLGGKIEKNATIKAHYRYITRAFEKPIDGRQVLVRKHQRQMDTYIPARPFLKTQDADWKIIKKIITDYMTGR